MPFYSGSANDFGQLAAALRDACAANGWTVAGTVVQKGAAYVAVTSDLARLSVQGGTGAAGGEIVGGCATFGEIRAMAGQAVVFPVAYEIHVHESPDEVYLVVNYNAEFWQWAAFGISDVAGLAGTGLWYGGSTHRGDNGGQINLDPTGGNWSSTGMSVPALFFHNGQLYGEVYLNSAIHHGLDGHGWSGAGGGFQSDNLPAAGLAAAPRYARQPSTVNGASALLDYKVWIARPDAKVSLAADLGHARLVRIDNLEPKQVVALGDERWRGYPWYRKNAGAGARDGGYGVQHTGTLGWAIRYDGP